MDKDRARAIAGYLARISRARKRGDATEHTYRPFLQELIKALAKGITCINEPKGTKAGHPDLKVSLGETPLGFVETKDIDADLDAIVDSSQLRRYLKSIPNLILTDYLKFRWYQNGSEVLRCQLGAFSAKGSLRRNPGGEDKLGDIIDNFTQAEVKTIGSPKELAQRMAALAKLTRRHVVELFASEEPKGDLHSLLKAFREVLLPDLDEKSFADMYAQTVCYGLFASICNSMFPQQFARENAADNLPATNPFLRRLFHHIVGPDLHTKVREDIERIVFLLKHADIPAILKDFGKRTRQEDPVVHFYETFLAEYDPKLRKSRGVYYTPEPVVSYIVRSVDWLLKEKFDKKDGLADPSVIVLDPACGTGTFLYTVIRLIHERVQAKGQYGAWSSYVRQNLLPRIFGFELLMAPYAVAHLKLGLLLKDTGYDFSGDERLGVYLTNTLEEAAKKSDILFAEYISDEANAATEVKKDKPVMVVLGNPPYSGHSANKGKWIADLVEDYKRGHPELYRPAQAKWLHDDYVKFIRWSQWRLARTGAGIHGYISNHSYLDNPTFKGMRLSLAKTFPVMHIVNLHGNAKKKEQCPDGTKDENVFDIMQGVALGLFTRPIGQGRQAVSYADCWGSRDAKYSWLAEHDASSTEWTSLEPDPGSYLLVVQDTALRVEYEKGHRLPDLMDLMGDPAPGMVTTHDEFAISWSREEAAEKVRRLLGTTTEVEARALFRLCSQAQWSYSRAKKELADGAWKSKVGKVLYRPFDTRWTVYDRNVTVHQRLRATAHLLRSANLALVTMRQVAQHGEYTHIGVTSLPVDNRAFYSSKGIMSLLPLYIYHRGPKSGLFSPDEPTVAPGGRRANLSTKFIKEFSGKLGLEFAPDGKGDLAATFGPEDAFSYIYAVFHSPTYRKRYAEFLKIDFPRVPLTSSKPLFRKLCALGSELVALHLMESPALNTLVTRYPERGSDAVERVSFNGETKRVYINDDQYFEGIRPEEWEFHIGGYQVLDKWLKDRKKAKRKLSADDTRHYQRIVVAIRNTIRLMSAIDEAVLKWPIE